MIDKYTYIEYTKSIVEYKMSSHKHPFIYRYIKMMKPRFGKFSNGDYDILGICVFGLILGRCVYSRWNSVMNVGDFVKLKEYDTTTDTIPQYVKL